jgi:HEAT repeat protein
MHAALIARDPRDVDALSEVARLDPEPIVRTDAVRALAVIGGAPVVSKLRDLWSSADEPLREDIAAAWASPAVFDAEEQGGGHGELRLLLAQGHGPAAIEGAGVVLRGVVHDAELASSATALLARVMGKGSTRDRLHAIAIAPRAPAGPILDSLRDAAKSDDVTVRVAALARLTESPTDREASIRALETIAGDAERHATAARAKLSLASAGDLRVQAWVEADLVADDPSIRLSAAAALAALGRAGRAAPLLADSDASVRMRAACTLLVAARR